MPKVSVIVPNYNHATYLEQRIQSILKQTYQDFELIILDDKSSDDSRLIINSFKDHPKVSNIVLNDINSGSTFKQWEKGINKSTGEYIWIAESDDYSDERFLMKMVSLLDNHPTASLAFSQSYYIDSKNRILFSGMKNIGEIWKTNLFLNSNEALREFIWHTQIVNASSVVFRREKYNSIKSNAYINFKICGDWFFWINLLEEGDLLYDKEELNYFRQHDNNVRGHQSISCTEILEQLELYNYMKINHKSLIGKADSKRVERRIRHTLYLKLCQRFNGQKISKLYTSIYKSAVEFPVIIILLPKLILLNIVKKMLKKYHSFFIINYAQN